MCGIVGYIGSRDAIPVLVKGLEHLEYRGYDSAGVACLNEKGDGFSVVKERGKLIRLKDSLKNKNILSKAGIGHTRWATHGVPSGMNAHPHVDYAHQIALVHNGIIENYAAVKAKLIKKGVKFKSETDTEVAANLFGYHYKKNDPIGSFKTAIDQLEGFFAFVVLTKDHPDQLMVFKRSNPIVIGLGENENFVASDVSALLPYTKKVIYLEDNEIAILTPQKVEIVSLKTKQKVHRKPTEIKWTVTQAAKGGYQHFMLKEINEQPEVIDTTIKARMPKGKIYFDSIDRATEKKLKEVKRVHFVSCGTAYHAGLVGNYMLGECVALPVECTVSSEFRYEEPAVDKDDLVILITQSGETADTLAALREAKSRGALTLAIVNVVGSTIAREADAVIYTHAGPEIGVASTKAYTAQLMVLAMFAIYLSQLHAKRKIKKARVQQLLKEMATLPQKVSEVLKTERTIHNCAKHLYRKQTFLYLGRSYNYPNALEGALKLKEITYSHAHGYPAGEMKHGPIALIDPNQPVICLAPHAKTYDKMISNIEEIKARKGIIISVASKGDKAIKKHSRYVFEVPKTEEIFSAILTAIPLQIFAYKVAVMKKRDVDQPRNLAKSVTVE